MLGIWILCTALALGIVMVLVALATCGSLAIGITLEDLRRHRHHHLFHHI